MTETIETKTLNPESWYVNKRLYSQLSGMAEAWRNPESQPLLHDRNIEDALVREARLLDCQNYEAWIDLYADECIYWIPASWLAGNPGEAITLEFHDRRRLIDRITRLQTGVAYSQVPPSRTSRIIGRPEIWQWEDSTVLARAPFHLHEFRRGAQQMLSGWYGYALEKHDEAWRIKVKQVNLLDCDEPQGNNSFFL